ncbi:DUF2156 domain-containing protein [Geomobilimonas luticola]|uniref:DUF2156 domain-containing protein n=1 Tax=Geomobilimonas luticola TaxID=1114878 RepID=A0ABS5SG08_9BACT|nr:phosphatidylglycerol lysyltransferase domain-containing protein [Geomobilimonas luticola]MBT0653536.1 DUF2156 domain-containing protein [Geomobilimonas luticola]
MNIPPYPDARDLGLADKRLLDDLFSRIQPRVSEFTFANLYLFRVPHAYRLTMVGDSLVVLGRGYGGEEYFLPPLSGEKGRTLHFLLAKGLTLAVAEGEFIEEYLDREGMEIIEDRDNFDYLYLRQELAELAGNRFHKKKNRVNYFTGRYGHVVELYGRNHLAGAMALLEEWFRVRGEMESPSIAQEVAATREALELAGDLGLAGVVVLVEGVVQAFALGERLNETTSVCHFEKSDPFLEGVSQLVDREFNRLLFTDCRFVNREQDLGEPGLRAAKLSYHPVELVKKFRVRRV